MGRIDSERRVAQSHRSFIHFAPTIACSIRPIESSFERLNWLSERLIRLIDWLKRLSRRLEWLSRRLERSIRSAEAITRPINDLVERVESLKRWPVTDREPW